MLGRHSPATIKEFWEHLQRFAPEELKDHPALDGCDLSKMIPLLIHFDGAEMYKNSEYNIWSFSSALSSLLDVDCLETQFVCCILPQKDMQQKQACAGFLVFMYGLHHGSASDCMQIYFNAHKSNRLLEGQAVRAQRNREADELVFRSDSERTVPIDWLLW